MDISKADPRLAAAGIEGAKIDWINSHDERISLHGVYFDEKENLESLKNKLKDKEITFKVKTGNNDKVFGTITTKQISEELTKMGFDIDKKKIKINGEINSLGYHNVTITLHKKVVFDLKIVLTK